MKVPLWRMLCEFFELMSTSLSKSTVIPQTSSRSWISSIFSFIWDQVSLFRLPNMPRSRRRHRTRSHSRARSHSAGSLQYEHKRRRIDYESPRSKGTYSGERVLRSRQHDRGTSQERRYKRSHRRSPSSGRQHGHRDRDRDRLAHPTSSRRARIYRHHVSSSTSQDRHRHRSPSSRSQVSLNGADNRREFVVAFCPVLYLHLILYRLTHTPRV
ncbi:splicing factor U2af large subunit B-like isoform X2 [Frieseomelitta varia]|uniref:splicing factor U2af large subunit B-like isoform X2 n=2 Tax=Frieseomelitta varia TaxID=561572 RepID=UPI001CB68D04|nr:splicing factor U2af large subunit B-like isoform X2 [Frieseomelitta varia]